MASGASLRSWFGGGGAVLAACFCTCLALGSCFSIGNLTTYVTSYLRSSDGGVDYAHTMILNSVLRVVMGPVYAVGGLLHPRLGPRLTTALGGGLLVLGTALSFLAVQHSLAELVATYSPLQGAGIAITFASTSLTSVAWFPRHRGLALGVNVGGFVLGPVVFNWVQTGYVNAAGARPDADGYFSDSEVLRRVPALFLLQAVVQATLLLPALLLLRRPPADNSADGDAGMTMKKLNGAPCKANYTVIDDKVRSGPPDCSPDEKTAHKQSHQQTDTKPAVTKASAPVPRTFGVVEALRTRQFYQLLIGYVPVMVAFEFYQVSWKTFGLTFLSDDRLLASIGSISPIFALLGNLSWGHLGDVTSFRSVLVVANGLMAVFFFTFPAMPRLGAVGYSAWVWALAGSLSALFACQLPVITSYFGERNAGVLLGLMNMVRAVFTPVSPLLARLLLHSNHGYPALFLLQGAFAAVAMLSLIFTLPADKFTQKWKC